MPDRSSTDLRKPNASEDLLKRIREDFAYVRAYWHDNYEEAAKDMECMAAKPPKDFSNDRRGRPCIWPDETSQYVTQANNNDRQNKRSITISPRSEDATDKDAEHRQAYFRGIEYASKAQAIYASAIESCRACAFGFWRIILKKTGPKGEQEPRFDRIPNWSTVYMDPDAREADFSDSMIAFVLDSVRENVFSRRYPKAAKQSFTADDRVIAPDWFNGGHVTVAEYWTREEEEVQNGEKRFKVTQRITNGVEILATHAWIGSWIPIIGVFGQELWIKEGGQSKRLFMSMIRRGRPAQQMMAYYASQEAEEFNMMPRAPVMGFKGQFINADTTWKKLNKNAQSYIEVGVPKDWNPQWGAPPLPQRTQFIPNPQAYEMAYERWRRSHQAAISGNPLPTDAQKVNDKSGIALQRIENAGAIGSFHFTDNFVRALQNTALQTNELVTKLAELDSLPSQLLGKNQKDEDVQIRIAPRLAGGSVPPESSEHLPEADYFFAHRGQFEVTASDGPSYLSQREEISAFADKLIEEVPALGLAPQITQQIVAIAIQMKNLGPLGEELSNLLAPPDPQKLPPEAKAILAQAQGAVQQLQAKVQELTQEREGKVIEGQFKVWAEQIKSETQKAVAEITTKAQILSERVAAIEELNRQLHDQAHDVALSAQEHSQTKELAARNAMIASAQSAQNAAQNQPPQV